MVCWRSSKETSVPGAMFEEGSSGRMLECELRAKCICVSHSVVSNSLRSHGLQSARLLCPWNSPAKNTEVGCHSFLQGIFLTQGLNLGLLHCRQTLYHLSQ